MTAPSVSGIPEGSSSATEEEHALLCAPPALPLGERKSGGLMTSATSWRGQCVSRGRLTS